MLLTFRPPSLQDFLKARADRADSSKCVSGGDLSGCVPRVHCIGIGADAARPDLQDLAKRTDGIYQFVSEVPGYRRLRGVKSDELERSLSEDASALALELSEVYLVINEDISGFFQVTLQQGEDLPPFDEDPVVHEIVVEGHTNEAVFIFAWTPTSIRKPTVQLVRPDNTAVEAETTSCTGHLVWRISSPAQGVWKILANSAEIIIDIRDLQVSSTLRYMVEASISGELVMSTSVEEGTSLGSKVAIYAFLDDIAPLVSQSVTASIIDPAGSSYGINLFDDGRHNDGKANDGTYGRIFGRTSIPGQYKVVIEASGTSPYVGYTRAGSGFHLGWRRAPTLTMMDYRIPGRK